MNVIRSMKALNFGFRHEIQYHELEIEVEIILNALRRRQIDYRDAA